MRAGVALEFATVLLARGLAGGHPGQVVATVRVECAVQRERHEFDELARVANRPEGDAPAEFGNGRTGSPFHAKPFDEQLRSGTLEDPHPVVDRLPGVLVLAPVRGEEPEVLRGRRASG